MPTRACVAAVQRNASPARTSGDNSAVAPPVPIPNTAVKRCSPDGSATKGRARVGRRQNPAPKAFGAGLFLLVALPHLTFRVALVSRARLGVSSTQTFLLVFPIVIRVRRFVQ